MILRVWPSARGEGGGHRDATSIPFVSANPESCRASEHTRSNVQNPTDKARSKPTDIMPDPSQKHDLPHALNLRIGLRPF